MKSPNAVCTDRHGRSSLQKLLQKCHLLALAMLLLTACQAPALTVQVDQTIARLDLGRKVAQLVASPVDVPTVAAAIDLERRLNSSPIGGVPGTFWIEDAPAEAVAALSATASRRPLPILVGADLHETSRALDLNGSELPIDRILLMGDASTAADAGEFLARRAAVVGVDLLAVRVPSFALQPLGAEQRTSLPERVESIVEAALDEGLQLGLTMPWEPESTVAGGRAEPATLQALRATSDRIPAILLSTSETSLLLSSDNGDADALIEGGLRRDLGWQGLAIADLRGLPHTAQMTVAVNAVRTGADLVITAMDPAAAIDGIAAAVLDGRLKQERVDEAARRVIAFKLDRTSPPAVPPDSVLSRLAGIEPPRGLEAASAPAASAPTLQIAAPAAVGMDEEELAAIEQIMEEAIGDSVFTAAAVAVGRGGALVYVQGFGATTGASTRVDPAGTLFDLASLSKVVGTTTAAAILIDQGLLEWDTPVRRHLPAFRGEHKREVTVRHLLSHTSGLPSGLWLYGSADSREEAIAQVLRQPLLRPPGEAVLYSDLGMIILAELIEQVAEMPIDELLAMHVFAPLGMSNTTYLPPIRLRDEIVPTALRTERSYPLQGVVHDGNAFRLGGVAGHAGIFSTALDVAVFSQMMLNGGAYGPVRILEEETARELTRRQPGADERALGWDTPADRSSAGRFFSSESFGHTGYTGTSIWIDPTRHLFVVLLTNRTYPEASAREILDLRIEIHEAVAQSVSDQPVNRRPGAR